MNVVVVGGGTVGKNICRDLSYDGHNITLVEKDSKIIENVINTIDVTAVVGNGATFDTLTEAGVQSADIFIAVTDSDELNIMSSIIAHKIGAGKTLARVRDPEYSQNMNFVRRDLGIDMMINPEREAAKKIFKVLKFASAHNVETFMGGKVNIVEFLLNEDNPLVGKALKELSLDEVLICMVERGEEVYVPKGNFVLEEGDQIHVTGQPDSLKNFVNYCNIEDVPISSIMIIGAGQLAYYLVEMLTAKGFRVKLIEEDVQEAMRIAEDFPQVQVIHGQGTDHDFLRQEGIRYYDSLVALTSIDEENIVLSLFAKSIGINKIIAKIDQDNLETIADNLDIESIINPKNIIADTILKFIKSNNYSQSSKINNLHRMSHERVYGIQFHIKEGYETIGVELKDLELHPETLIACINRQGEIIYPKGNDYIAEGDQVLVITKQHGVEEIGQILGDRNE